MAEIFLVGSSGRIRVTSWSESNGVFGTNNIGTVVLFTNENLRLRGLDALRNGLEVRIEHGTGEMPGLYKVETREE